MSKQASSTSRNRHSLDESHSKKSAIQAVPLSRKAWVTTVTKLDEVAGAVALSKSLSLMSDFEPRLPLVILLFVEINICLRYFSDIRSVLVIFLPLFHDF